MVLSSPVEKIKKWFSQDPAEIFRNEHRELFGSYTLCFDQPVPRDFRGNLKAKVWEIMF